MDEMSERLGSLSLPPDRSWLNIDLWTVEEAAWLLAGVDPNSADLIPERPLGLEAQIRVRYRQALEALQRADLAEKITTTQCGKYLVTESVIAWACDGKKWPAFPFTPDDLRMQEGARGPSARWPWGSYETDLLRKLAEAVEECWLEYHPDRARDSAPKNTEVVEFLKTKGVSKAMAAKIATIIRADGLPPGQRVNKVDND